MVPKVSIIIPTYNRAHYLPEALESALNQTYPNIEVIVVNDGSTDNTEAALAPYIRHIRYVRRENGGCAASKNTGLEVATGTLITNLDDDDRMHPERISRQALMFMERPNLGLCGTGVNFIDTDGNVTGSYIPPKMSPKTQVIQLLRSCALVQSSVLIHRKCHDHLGNYKLTHSQDYDFWLRVSLHYEIDVIPEALTDYRHHEAQITGAQNRPNVRKAVGKIVENFVSQTPIDRIIPGLRAYPEGHALMGLLLCEQRLTSLAEAHLMQALPSPAGDVGLFLLRLHERNFSAAETHAAKFASVDSPFSAKGEDASRLIAQVKALTEAKDAYHNMSPEVVTLRNDVVHFHTTAIRDMLRLAS